MGLPGRPRARPLLTRRISYESYDCQLSRCDGSPPSARKVITPGLCGRTIMFYSVPTVWLKSTSSSLLKFFLQRIRLGKFVRPFHSSLFFKVTFWPPISKCMFNCLDDRVPSVLQTKRAFWGPLRLSNRSLSTNSKCVGRLPKTMSIRCCVAWGRLRSPVIYANEHHSSMCTA